MSEGTVTRSWTKTTYFNQGEDGRWVASQDPRDDTPEFSYNDVVAILNSVKHQESRQTDAAV